MGGVRGEIPPREFHAPVVFVLIWLAVFALHLPLLHLPYFWDEAGYYVPATRDLFLSGSLVPHSTPSNAHPPLVMACLALAWKIAGYAPEVTRAAMLLLAAFSLLGVFQLARRIANLEVAIASTICTALYPVFFAQSSLAHLDLATAGFTQGRISRSSTLGTSSPLTILRKCIAAKRESAICCQLGDSVLRSPTMIPKRLHATRSSSTPRPASDRTACNPGASSGRLASLWLDSFVTRNPGEAGINLDLTLAGRPQISNACPIPAP